jgi:hypothetical protein
MSNSRGASAWRVRSYGVSVLLFGASGCAYFNGVYNANAAAKVAAGEARHGRDSAAAVQYARSAESAETVLVRYPESAWRPRALFLAGRGEALSGDCTAAVNRLHAFLAAAGTMTSGNRDEVAVAQRTLDTCTIELQRVASRDSAAASDDSATARAVRDVETAHALDSIVLRATSHQKSSLFLRRLNAQTLFYRMLMDDGNSSDAAQFLAAEIARDSLHAVKLASATFLSIVAQAPASLLAPKALRSAALLLPEQAAALSARILREYPSSSVAAWMRGDDAGGSVDFAASDSVLRAQWAASSRAFADTLAKLRVPTGGAQRAEARSFTARPQ